MTKLPTATARFLLAALSEVEGSSPLGLLADSILKGSDLRRNMRQEDISDCEANIAEIGDLGYQLQEYLHNEWAGWTQ